MGRARWGSDPEFFGPRHAHREARIMGALGPPAQPGELHLECAAGVGSLSTLLAGSGRTVVAADRSLRSLLVAASRRAARGSGARVLPVVADITALPFREGTFATATTAETLEHIPDDGRAVRELARVLAPGGLLVGTVPAGPSQWSDWDDWAGHLRRYTSHRMAALLREAGLEPDVTRWGWPLVRMYDGLFLKRVNRRRLRVEGPVQADPALRAVGRLGRHGWLVRLVTAAFALDRPFDGSPWGVGLLFSARKPRRGAGPTARGRGARAVPHPGPRPNRTAPSPGHR